MPTNKRVYIVLTYATGFNMDNRFPKLIDSGMLYAGQIRRTDWGFIARDFENSPCEFMLRSPTEAEAQAICDAYASRGMTRDHIVGPVALPFEDPFNEAEEEKEEPDDGDDSDEEDPTSPEGNDLESEDNILPNLKDMGP